VHAKAHFEANYGALTPQDVASDRFGLNQCVETWSPQAPYGTQLNTIVSARLGSPVRRLDLILRFWRRYRYHGNTEYKLSVHGRPMIITHYHDGRLKIWLDDKVIYQQTRRARDNQLMERYDYDSYQDEEVRWEESLEQVRERLERASAHRRS
jgi:hypothetical protein